MWELGELREFEIYKEGKNAGRNEELAWIT